MKKLFFTGLILLLPFLITYLVLAYFIAFITSPFDWLVHKLLEQLHLFEHGAAIFSKQQVTHFLSKFLVLLSIIILIFLVGVGTHRFSSHLFHRWLDWALGKIPLINKIYSASRELTSVLFAPKDEANKQSALVPYPSEHDKSLGLVIQNVTTDVLENQFGTLGTQGRDFVLVLIPCTPNPTVGYLCLFPKKDVALVDVSSEETMKYILSCGSLDLLHERVKKSDSQD